jgi:hypothetical protein
MRLGPRLVFSGFVLCVGVHCSGQSDDDEGGPHGTSASAGAPTGVAAGRGGSPGVGGGAAGHAGSSSVGGVPSTGGDGSGGDAGAGNAAGHDESMGGSGLGGNVSGGGDAGEAGARPTSATGCRHVSCTPLVLSASGSWDPSTDSYPRSMGDTCATPGAAYIDCIQADGCPSESEPNLFMCCDFGSDGGGSFWANACANLCPNDGGQGGESGTSCTEPPSACCTKDADCPSGFECAKGGYRQPGDTHPGAGNTCLPRLADRSSCWQDRDCPVGYGCVEASFCGCGYGPCADFGPGFCEPEGR